MLLPVLAGHTTFNTRNFEHVLVCGLFQDLLIEINCLGTAT